MFEAKADVNKMKAELAVKNQELAVAAKEAEALLKQVRYSHAFTAQVIGVRAPFPKSAGATACRQIPFPSHLGSQPDTESLDGIFIDIEPMFFDSPKYNFYEPMHQPSCQSFEFAMTTTKCRAGLNSQMALRAKSGQ
eukprot:1158208-Pelagomonas_calceolata.AAC.16